MKRTPLYQEHVTLGANIVEFAGWDMPMHFKQGIVGEHNAVRNSAGAFDVSHMGDIVIRGPGALATVQKVFTNDYASSKIGQAKYAHILDDKGMIIDDTIVTKLAEDEFLCVPNAATTPKILDWMTKHNQGAVLENHSGEIACVAVQGPKAAAIVEKLFGSEAAALKNWYVGFFPIPEAWHVNKNEKGARESVFSRKLQQETHALVSRTGYTGEDGFEILVPLRAGPLLWRAVLEPQNDCHPIGLGARDTLRMEMGYLLSGQDFHENRTTLETAYDWVIKWNHDFIGKGSLEAQKAAGGYHKFTGVVLEESGVPRHGYPVLSESGEELCKLTSGTMSPTLGKGIGLGYFDPAKAAPGTIVYVEIRGRKVRGKIAKTPLVKRG
jgi:aminomethyltransferase